MPHRKTRPYSMPPHRRLIRNSEPPADRQIAYAWAAGVALAMVGVIIAAAFLF